MNNFIHVVVVIGSFIGSMIIIGFGLAAIVEFFDSKLVKLIISFLGVILIFWWPFCIFDTTRKVMDNIEKGKKDIFNTGD